MDSAALPNQRSYANWASERSAIVCYIMLACGLSDEIEPVNWTVLDLNTRAVRLILPGFNFHRGKNADATTRAI